MKIKLRTPGEKAKKQEEKRQKDRKRNASEAPEADTNIKRYKTSNDSESIANVDQSEKAKNVEKVQTTVETEKLADRRKSNDAVANFCGSASSELDASKSSSQKLLNIDVEIFKHADSVLQAANMKQNKKSISDTTGAEIPELSAKKVKKPETSLLKKEKDKIGKEMKSKRMLNFN